MTQPTQEIRFAVVMYGGSSLSIYMYGIAQELLRLVRSTGPTPDGSGSERVYREVAQRLFRGQQPDLTNDVSRNPIGSKFVIDLLSGTSAGGINSVFLAKALVNDQGLDALRNLWVKDADFAKLLNDDQSSPQARHRQNPPKSLVNSPRLYGMLSEAFANMKEGGNPSAEAPEWRSPYVDELELFTTFTDVQGQQISVKLADQDVSERKHLHNLHFVYSSGDAGLEPRNDFVSKYDPFLAFAARSSSAHQAAFEPMALNDIAIEGYKPDDKLWWHFYQEYLQPNPFAKRTREDLAKEFQARPLVDGGTLDNSPFTFAIEQLRFRHARLPVDRKLIYVEPDPSDPELAPDKSNKPDFIKNALMGLSTIPSYQFIRDDIQRIADRNSLIDRVNRVLDGIEMDHAAQARSGKPVQDMSSNQFQAADLADMIEIMGPAWGGYHTLRVQETMTDLARIVASAAGFDEESREFTGIQTLVQAWRRQSYSARREPGKKTENQFLYDFDLHRHMRRLKFVIRKAADIGCFDARIADNPTTKEIGLQAYKTPEFKEDARRAIATAIEELSEVLRGFYKQERILTASADPIDGTGQPVPVHPLRDELVLLTTALAQPASPGASRPTIWEQLLSLPLPKARRLADDFVTNHEKLFGTLTDSVRAQFDVISEASLKIRGKGQGTGILEIPGSSANSAEAAVKQALLSYYEHFDRYDMVAYPILYSTEAGDELDKVEVFRVSPKEVHEPIHNPKKLAGLSLGHFGALVDEKYRLNDILWGRLDAAERLITLLLKSAPAPDHPAEVQQLEQHRQRLIREAQTSIVMEEVGSFPEELKKKLGFSDESLRQAGTGLPAAAAAVIAGTPLSPAIKDYVQSLLRVEDPLDKFVKNYGVLHVSDDRKLVSLAGRASRILGKMLDDIADQYHVNSPLVAWFTRLLRIFWGFTEVSLPDSFVNIVTTHLLRLLYLFEAVLIIGGIVFASNPVRTFGLTLFGITIAANAVVLVLKDVAENNKKWVSALKVVVIGAVFVASLIMLLGLLSLVLHALGSDLLWNIFHYNLGAN